MLLAHFSLRLCIATSKKVKMSPKKWFVLGISGATCSGKTSLANQIHKELKNSVILHQDDYFLPANDPRHTKIPELNHMNWEIITSIDMDKMRSDILKLIESSAKDLSEMNGRRVLILDGFLLFNCKFIANLCDLKYFITLTKEQCWERRRIRTYDPPDISGYFEKIVWPEYVKHKSELMTEKGLYKEIIFIDGSKSKEEIFKMILSEIKKKVNDMKC